MNPYIDLFDFNFIFIKKDIIYFIIFTKFIINKKELRLKKKFHMSFNFIYTIHLVKKNNAVCRKRHGMECNRDFDIFL